MSSKLKSLWVIMAEVTDDGHEHSLCGAQVEANDLKEAQKIFCENLDLAEDDEHLEIMATYGPYAEIIQNVT